ncbi:MAG: LemA family protein [Candidatus Taylorbacteria bacterium]|nr:LemA family protein [Candidatus Taylorbacteria bacterium]
MKKITWIVLIIVVLVILFAWSSYNRFVSLSESVNNQWAQVETQYQRRFDLIPNLVESVKGVMKQEQAVFTAIADARTKYAGAKTVDAKAQAAGQMESALGRLLVISENYPELKSAETVQTLMAQLEGTENRVSVERKRFNDIVQSYNLRTKRFPGSIFASIFGFTARPYLESVKGSENAPKVEF